jgi:hypothetical protein
MISTVYIRSADGYVQDLPADEGVEHWLGNDGYRITFKVGSYEFILRRPIDGLVGANSLGQSEVEAANVVVRRAT